MRNSILLLLLTLFSTTYSQNNDSTVENLSTIKKKSSFKDNFSMGFHLSPTISWFDVKHDDMQTDGATITGGLGIVAEYNATKLLSIVSGLNFSLPGGYVFDNASMADDSTKNNYRINYTTLELPILIRANLTEDKKTTFYIQGGASVDYRFSASEFHKAATYLLPDKKLNIKSLIDPFNFNYLVGFGTKQRIFRKYYVFAEVNYKHSLSNIASEKDFTDIARYTTTLVPEIHSGNMIFSFGVLF